MSSMDSLSQIPGLGTKTLEKLAKLNIKNPLDLLYHFPHRYLDFSRITSIKNANDSETITITGQVTSFRNIFTRTGKNLQKAAVADKTGSINLIWFNQPYLSTTIRVGDVLSFAGTVTIYQGKPTIIAPEYGQYSTGSIIAVYPETAKLSSKWFRKTIQSQLGPLTQNIKETLPPAILNRYHLPHLHQALYQIHSPINQQNLDSARLRLALDEILSIQSQSYLQKAQWLKKTPQKILVADKTINGQINQLIKSLPFQLTPSQAKVWTEIKTDLLATDKPTNRLLQGDVGSGKTVVAVLAAYLNSLNHHLTLYLSPTEILTRQHFQTFTKILKPTGVPLYLMTSSSHLQLDKIEDHAIILSTHAALYQKDKIKDRLGLLIIDEQHKFGVAQRSSIQNPLHPPHCLTMTATPIPRTIFLTILGHLDLSTIESPPKNRLPVKTFLVPNFKRPNCYAWIKDQISRHHSQAFIVCPFIEQSESFQTVKSAIKEFDHLSKNIFPDLRLGLIHSQTKDKDKVISDFQVQKLDILVTTPIIEVGIDIPNASIIIIQSADRFGLAQLHQLRGRVGRGNAQSYCYLFTESTDDKTTKRLEYLQTHHHGLQIAEYDLKIRGPGETFSTLQHGFPSLKLADLSDTKLISLGQLIIKDLIANFPAFDLKTLITATATSITTAN